MNRQKEQKKRDKSVVSYTMSRIRGQDTSIELRLRKALWAEGFRYRKNYRGCKGTPDIAFIRPKVAVFCDSTFWHGLDWPDKKKQIKTNREFWIRKIERNIARDISVNEELTKEGWLVLRFSDKEINKELEVCIEKVKNALVSRRL
ncbi:MAG: very short patch repair endonuclease [Gaiellales bacterium]|nr:MAG: very short patch repair endonuclease [Gaiellales bacterium]